MSKEIEKMVLLLDRIYSKSKKHASAFDNTGLKNLENTLGILVLGRIVGNLNATKILLQEIQSNLNVEPAIGLILRNNLSLCKIVFKHSEIQDSNSDFTEFYKFVFGENIQKTIKYIKKNHTQKEIQPSLDNIKKEYTFILKKTGIDIDNIENEKFHSSIKLSSKFDTLENLFAAYSKYEHFGLNTLILQGNNEIDEKLERINIAVHYSLQGILICLSMLQIIDDDLMRINKEFGGKARTPNKAKKA